MCNFRDPNLVAFYFSELTHFFRLNETHFTFHLQYKHSGTFANHKYGELSYPQNSENVRPHYSQSSRENATQSSGTSPLASYKEVLPSPPWAQNSNTANGKGVMSCEDKLEGLKLIATDSCFIRKRRIQSDE